MPYANSVLPPSCSRVCARACDHARGDEMQALRTSVDPRTLDDPAGAFAEAPPIPFAKPSKWPGPEAALTVARLLWDDSKLYIAYFCDGSFAEAVDPARCTAAALSALQTAYDPSYSDPRLQRVVMLDDRVEVFLCQTVTTPTNDSLERSVLYWNSVLS